MAAQGAPDPLTPANESNAEPNSGSAPSRAIQHSLPNRATLSRDAAAGLAGAIASVPDGMASSVLAGVSPIHGLYASMAGPIAGGLFSSTQRLVVTTTTAAAIAGGAAVSGLPPEERADALFLMTILTGALAVAAGLLRLGSLTRFVSHSVMVGFLTGIAVLIILGQLGTLTGYAPEGNNKVAQTIDLLRHLGEIDLKSVFVGGLAMILAITLPRTPLGTFGTIVALALPSVLVLGLGWTSVETVASSGEIPQGFPLPTLPSLAVLSLDVITGAMAVAVIVMVQGAGVAQTVPNRDGTSSDPSRDFIAQGVGNLASGLLRGIPVGGSTGQTALNAQVGAQSRWAAILSGVWMAFIIVVIPGLIGYVAMPALAALLILAGFGAIGIAEATSIWHTGALSRICTVVTFLATLFLPIQVAVALGAALAAILHLSRMSTDVALVELVPLPDGRTEERPPPERLPSNAVTVFAVYGSLFYAGAWTLARALPSPRGATNPAVVLRLRGHKSLGATFIDVLASYDEQIRAAGGRLYIAGLDSTARDQLVRTAKVQVEGPVEVVLATNVLGESTRHAYTDAQAWLLRGNHQDPAD
jgi:SulP family sulfate permease